MAKLRSTFYIPKKARIRPFDGHFRSLDYNDVAPPQIQTPGRIACPKYMRDAYQIHHFDFFATFRRRLEDLVRATRELYVPYLFTNGR